MGDMDVVQELEARASENWGHLLSTHVHEHNHPELEHVHIPHEDVEKEHRREGHIHDHARPADSPA